MTTMAFDTLQYANRLKAEGFPDRQAEVLAQTFGQVIEERLVTRRDLEVTELNIKNEFNLKLALLKTELIKWVLGVSIAQATVIISCIKLFH